MIYKPFNFQLKNFYSNFPLKIIKLKKNIEIVYLITLKLSYKAS